MGKFDIDKDKVSRWMELATNVLFPTWLQAHPNSYLKKMLEKSREQVRLLKQGGKVQTVSKQQEPLSKGNDPRTAEVNYANSYEGYAPVFSFKETPYDSS